MKPLAWMRYFAWAFLILMISAAVFAPLLSQRSPEAQDLELRLLAPEARAWLGTDALGRDLLARTLQGAQVSLLVGAAAGVVSVLFGLLIALPGAWRGGFGDRLTIRVIDAANVFPSLLIAILVGVFLGRGVDTLILTLALASWMTPARLIRAEVLRLKTLLQIESAVAIGASPLRQLFKHVLPALVPTLKLSLVLQVPQAVLAESFLSFMGLGVQPPLASWGTLASEGFRGMMSYPYLILAPGLAIFFTLYAFQLVSEEQA
jgi:ABC-type dipeptide/oligopeptide/nickel transport system permease subunit